MKVLELRKSIRKYLLKYGREKDYGYFGARLVVDTWSYNEQTGWFNMEIIGDNKTFYISESIGDLWSVNIKKLNKLKRKIKLYFTVWKNTNINNDLSLKDKKIIIELKKINMNKDF